MENKTFHSYWTKATEEGIVESIVAIMGIVDEGRDRIMNGAFAKTIKQTHNADEMNALADAMGVPAGKGDIFDRLVKSGHAANFEMAVMQVAAYINLDVEGGGRNAVGVASEPRIGL